MGHRRGDHGEDVRQVERAGEQRRRRGGGHSGNHHPRAVPLCQQRDERGRVPRVQDGHSGHAGIRRRLHHQHVVGGFLPRLPGVLRLQRGQGRRCRHDEVHCHSLPDEQDEHPLQQPAPGCHRHRYGGQRQRATRADEGSLHRIAVGPRRARGRSEPSRVPGFG